MLHRSIRSLSCLAGAILLAAACQGGTAPRSVALQVRNDSGVTGTVTISDAGNARSRVEIKVDPAGNPDMPTHIHPGSCAETIPQPRFPLESTVDGTSVTVVPASIAELSAGNLTVTLHKSNADMKTTVACGDI